MIVTKFNNNLLVIIIITITIIITRMALEILPPKQAPSCTGCPSLMACRESCFSLLTLSLPLQPNKWVIIIIIIKILWHPLKYLVKFNLGWQCYCLFCWNADFPEVRLLIVNPCTCTCTNKLVHDTFIIIMIIIIINSSHNTTHDRQVNWNNWSRRSTSASRVSVCRSSTTSLGRRSRTWASRGCVREWNSLDGDC